MRSRALLLLIALGITLGAAAGIGCRKKAGSRDASGRRILYYVDTMHPQYKSDKPGTAPDCGMPLSPVYADEVTPAPAGAATSGAASGSPSAGRKVLYWYDPMAPGSHFDKPGKSPFMDMQLVPRYADEPAAASAAAVPSGASLTLGADAIRATGIATVPVENGELLHEIRAVGAIQADETKLVHVAARVPGRVERLRANYTGEAVRRGAPLYDLYSPELVATQREYLLALENRQRLTGAGSEASAGADSLISAARDRMRLWGITESQILELEKTRRPDLALSFPSPISGTVLQKNVIAGQYVQEGTDLYLIADLSEVWLVAQAYESDLASLRVGQPAGATVNAYPGRAFGGRIAFIEPVLDPQTRTARVRIVLPNPRGELKPGMFADARLQIPLGRRLSVPRSAVIDTGTRQVVYVEAAPGTFVTRDVKVGSTAKDRVEILEG
ncbi:MAG: efflux RND transporter periplasmic adaptor subunit, partial [Acidobacteriota bacterium]|nr:efflux RND transporter periplasmic adaptor subunit [Acidobacteriota bacterium]